ncbi:MAG: hypothetical protein IPJ93_01285 [Bacteroidota bacterium]|nr:MAG: hypothetical protein IPJ93_01285 [Bacteroidota bacterium]
MKTIPCTGLKHSSGAGSEFMQGLRLSNSVHCGITGNAIENMESGIMVFGNCSQTNLYCNKFESCFNSTYFSNNNSSNQLTDQGLKVETMGTYDPTLSEGWKNHWVSPVSDKAAGVLLAPNIFNWMYKPSVSFDYDPVISQAILPHYLPIMKPEAARQHLPPMRACATRHLVLLFMILLLPIPIRPK